jgi:hypothetical protein
MPLTALRLDKKLGDTWFYKQLYFSTPAAQYRQDILQQSNTTWYQRLLGYVDKDCLKAGLDNAKAFFNRKDTGGKALSIGNMLLTLIIDKLLLVSIVGWPFLLLPLVASNWAQSGVGQAFHHGVKAAYAQKHAKTEH